MRLLDRILNFASVGVVVVLLALTARRYLGPADPGTAETMRPGTEVRLSGVDWSSNKHTLLFVLQPGCSFCKASAGFYRDLLSSNRQDAFHAIAIIPATPNEAGEFLSAYGIAIADLRSTDLGTLNVPGTPTLILVGSDGRVQNSWAGMLTAEREAEVFRALGLNRPERQSLPASPTTRRAGQISPTQLARVFRTAPIVDIRSRSEYDAEHIDGSLNIPLDEIESRAAHELPFEREVLLYCRTRSCVVTGPSDSGVLAFCESGREALEPVGFRHVTYIQADLRSLEAAGVRMARSKVKGRSEPR
jgi:hypothetical protein